MEPNNKRTYYVQKASDIQKTGASILPPTTSEFSEDLISSQQTEVVTFCDALRLLKEMFCLTNGPSSEQVLHQLKEVNGLLAESLKECRPLYSKDLLQMAALVNSKIEGYCMSMDLETKAKLSDVILCAINKLSFAFEKRLSGASSYFGTIHRTESFENLNLEQGSPTDLCLLDVGDAGNKGGEVDNVLLNVNSGIDKALQHAMSWLDSAKFIMTYIEKRTALELDFAKHLMKLAVICQQNMRCQTFPLQLTYNAAFTLDSELENGIQKFCTIIQTEKFLQPLSVRSSEHKKSCKDLKDLWSKEERQMREATENLRKCKAAYNSRCRELTKMKEATQRAIVDSNILNDSPALIRLEKRRKMEEETITKMANAQEQYQKCISFANDMKAQMNAAKKRILVDIRQLVDESDRILKMATVDYFTLMAARTTTVPLQFQALRKSSELYEPGSVYAQYAEMLGTSSNVSLQDEEPFVFQMYSPSLEDHDKQLNYTKRIQEFRKRISPLQEALPVEFFQDSDTKKENSDAGNCSSVSRSLDSSPVQSRRHVEQSHRKLTNSSSFNALTDLDDDKGCFAKSGCRDFEDVRTVRGLIMSKVAQMHDFKRLRTFARCRQCDCYVYFNGFECSLCGLSCHKLCLRNLRWECGRHKSQGSFHQYRSDRALMIDPKGLPDRVPYIVKKCIEQIDASGLEVKGIFRISAVKSRVDDLCQKLESEDGTIDLSSESPHTIAGLVRLYLRQLEEPLIKFQSCEELVNLIKNSSLTENNLELIQQMKSVLSCLPGENFWTLSCLIHHLKRVAQRSEVNMMSASNLAIVFGPTLMRMSNDMVTANSLVDNKYQCSVVEMLITHAEEIFGSDPIPSNHLSSEDAHNSATDEQAKMKESSVGEIVKGSGGSNHRTYVCIAGDLRSKMNDDSLLASSSSGEISVDDTLQHFAAESEARSTTIWFDQNVYNEPQSTENMTYKSNQGFNRLQQNSDDSDDGISRPASDSTSCYLLGLGSSAQMSRGCVDTAESSAATLLCSSFQRTQAYSPHFHRRIRASAPVRRGSLHYQKPYGAFTTVVKSTKSASDDEA